LRFLKQSVHFLENHDEQRAAAAFAFERHKAAAALVLFLPGMALLHDGQIEGRRQFAPIQMSKRAPEPIDLELEQFYREILKMLQKTWIRRGSPALERFESDANLITVRWEGVAGEFDFGVVNLGDERVLATKDFPGPCEHIYSTGAAIRESEDGQLSIPPGGHVLRFQPPGTESALRR
jgi:hypothetical protein